MSSDQGKGVDVRTPEQIGQGLVDGREQILANYGGRIVPVTDALGGLESSRELIENWQRFVPVLAGLAEDAPEIQSDSIEWRAPVMPNKLLCVGANYTDHLEEMAAAGGPKIEESPFPFSFLKPATTALVGSGQPVAIPSFGEQLDWEAELAVVIGRPELAESDPLGAIFGYSVFNDLSFRDFVAPFPHPLGLDALINKGWDGAAPMGPWITLAAAAGDPTEMAIELRVNGKLKQRSSTARMIFSVAELVAYYGRVLTLEPGDVIATGTPAGVGAGRQPQEFLSPGDQIEIEIGALGTLRTPIVATTRKRRLAIH
jgi:2-keto-4-pentenoate hydratase/2-oxohepta-3-ene-1,7-dioic acid hydratase in catechol pathway